MSRGGGLLPLLGDPGGGLSSDIEGYVSDTATGETIAFARSAKVSRSPVSKKTADSCDVNSQVQEEQFGLGLLFTPKVNSNKPIVEQQGRTMELRKKVDELAEFIKEKHNVHHKIRSLVTGIKSGVLAVEREQRALLARVENAEKKLQETTARLAEVTETPSGTSNSRSGKRDRDTPGEEEASKKQKEDEHEKGEHSGWKTVVNKFDKKMEKKRNEEKRKEEKKKEEKSEETKKEGTKKKDKPKLRREWNKGEALIIEAKDKSSYAALLRKVRDNPDLKELGEKVVKTRRTQKGEMLFELTKDPAVKSAAFKELVAKTLGNEANVRVLSQEEVIECRNIDEITTEEELRCALKGQCSLEEDVSMVIRMRKAYGGTQIAAIRLPMLAANKLLETGKIKVGWSVCTLKVAPRVTKQMERCFKCMGFGHQARNCAGPDRSKLCRKCGGDGHFASDCARPAKCMLCKPQDGNGHVTGGFKCPEYKKAMANQQ